MIIYFLILAICCFLIYLAESHKEEFLGKVYYILTALILILFGGLRNRSVGTDSGNYAGIYKSYEKVHFFQQVNNNIEIGFEYLIKIGHLISHQYVTLFILISSINVFIYIFLIKKFSYINWISLFVFFTLSIYMIYFNAARQSIAVAFFSLSLYYVYHKKFIPFIILVIVGALFHKSIFIVIPFYFLLNVEYNLKKFLGILMISSILFVVGGKVMLDFQSSPLERYTEYIDRNAKGGELLCLFYTVVSILFIVVRERMAVNGFQLIKIYDFYLKLCLFSTMIYIIVVLTGSDVNMIRMTTYFGLGYVLIWPIIFLYVKEMDYKTNAFLYGFMAVHLLFLYIMLGKMASLIPYQLNAEIF